MITLLHQTSAPLTRAQRSGSSGRLVCASLALGLAAAVAGVAAEPPATTSAPWDGKTELLVPKGTYFRCVLQTAADAKSSLTVQLALRDQVGTRAYVQSSLGGGLRLAEATEVKRDGARLTGTIVVAGVRATMRTNLPSEVRLTLDATIAGDRVTGTVRGQWDKTALDAAVTGVIQDEHALRKADPVAPDKDWPAWAGPHGDFSAPPSGRTLVQKCADARLVWASETLVWGGRGSTPDWQVGGYSSLIVGGGRVYLNQFEGSGEVKVTQDGLDGELTKGQLPRGQANPCISADDLVHCFDATTGQLLWKQRMIGASANGSGSKHVYLGKNGVYHDGRVYMFGFTWRVYCLDAQTGALLWHSDVGKAHQSAEQLKAEALQKKVWARLGFDFSTLDVAAGVPFCYDMAGKVIGLDTATGKIRWAVPGKAPVKWTHQGKQYIVLSTKAFGTDYAIIDPANGQVLLKFSAGEAMLKDVTTVSGDILLTMVPVPKNAEDTRRLQAHRLSLEAVTPVWQLDENFTAAHPNHPPAFCGDACAIKTHSDKAEVIEFRRLSTGALIARQPFDFVSAGYAWGADGRFLAVGDTNHTESGGPRLFDATTGAVGDAERWIPPHAPSCSYEMPMVQPYADGRMFFRGMRSVVCYDLRAP